jgi:hypothetical protein
MRLVLARRLLSGVAVGQDRGGINLPQKLGVHHGTGFPSTGPGKALSAVGQNRPDCCKALQTGQVAGV